jgi:hypothetical protein
VSLTPEAIGGWEADPMTTRTQQTASPRWVLPFLVALIAALAAILLGTTASASAAISHTVEPLVGPPQHVSAGQGRDAAGDSAGIVVATGVAANGVPRLGATFGGDKAIQNMSKWAARHPEPGYYDVIGHGAPNSLSGMSAS